MFITNGYAVPLFDFEKGGSARAFECLTCGTITKTEKGMRQHLKQVHNWEEQACLSSTDSQKEDQNQGGPRELRAGPPNLNPPKESQNAETTNQEQQQESQPDTVKKPGQLSLGLMREEK